MHGFGSDVFHSRCDGKPNTLLIVKSTTGYIFGGYTSTAWSSVDGYKIDKTAFLFTLTNPANMTLKLNLKAENEEKAVYHNSGNGPIFGAGRDLCFHDQSNTNSDSHVSSVSYDAPNGQTGDAAGIFYHGGSTKYFQTVDVEVYQIA